MWSPDRRTLILSLLAVAGCGFTPVYGPGGGGETLRGRVGVAPPGDPRSFALANRIEDRLGVATTPVWRIEPRITVTGEGPGLAPDGSTTRFNLIGRADWTLVRLDSGQAVLSGTAQGFTGVSATGSTVAGRAAVDAAEDRLMVILADQIVTRLLAAAATLTP